MSGRSRGISGHHAEQLNSGWALASCAPGEIDAPGALGDHALEWIECPGPMTAAAALRAAGRWSLDGAPRRFDAEDWWYRARFRADPAEHGEQIWLCCDGLATIAELWLNGTALLPSANMFRGYESRVDALLRPENELVIRFHALDRHLAAKRPRPRWRAPMVEQQQLRWVRTTLLGRTPGWSPPAAAVGPWRPVRLERRRGILLDALRLDAAGDGRLTASCRLTAIDSRGIDAVSLVVDREGRTQRASLELDRATGHVRGVLTVADVAQWWPHTHGTPALYDARLEITRGGGLVQADLGAVGFRDIALDTAADDFAIAVNGAPIFCRGACWTPLDPVSFANEATMLDATFDQVVDGGMNMLRVGGTMTYEGADFLDRCDARGVLLWQDFMFANFDYPEEDPAFVDETEAEVREQLSALQGRPSLAVLCGSSEGEQQAAMWGAPRERWRPPLFHERIAGIALALMPAVPYWPSSAHGGSFPHQANAGSTSYYGVGAYLRPLEDARRAEVRFASECLAFANLAEERSLPQQPGGAGVKVHHPEWKRRTPRDLGAGWDFDDVRDHYLARLFAVDPVALRYADHDRYLALGREVTGEVMSQVFGEWRRRRSITRGGLVLFLRDLWPGAGWGVIDALGVPKAAYHHLRRALAPVALHLADEGVNGLVVHAVNDGAAFDATVELTLWRAGEVRVGHAARPLHLASRSAIELDGVEFFEGFRDLSYAYRFGPPAHDVAVATLRGADGIVRARAFHFVGTLPHRREADVGLAATAHARSDGRVDLVVRTRRFAQAVHVDVPRFACSDDHFHLPPGEEHRVVLTPQRGIDAATRPQGHVVALNSEVTAKVVFA